MDIDAGRTAISLGYFTSIKKFRSAERKLSRISVGKNLVNFNPARLKSRPGLAYPKSDRPRGEKDLVSVKYWMKMRKVEPIWILKKDGESVLLDGAHRLVASYIMGKKTIPVWIVYI